MIPPPQPHNLEAEQGLIGAILYDPRVLDAVGDAIAPEHFHVPAHQRIFAAIRALETRGAAISAVALRNHFDRDKDLEGVGGAQYLADLVAGVIAPGNARDYAATIRDLALRRALIAAAIDTIDDAARVDVERPASAVLDAVETRVTDIARGRGWSTEAAGIGDSLDVALKVIEAMQAGHGRGVMSGIGVLDAHLGGFQPGDLVLLGGRPGMGKTALALTLAVNAAAAGIGVLMFSLEMRREELAMRLLARETAMPVQQQRREGAIRREGWDALSAARRRMAALPIAIDDAGALTAAQIRARARRESRRMARGGGKGLGLIVIDYLGLMTAADARAPPVYQLAQITKDIKGMAKEMGVPVLLLHQLSRSVESRDDKRPMMADLRDSGQIEQDADVILFVYREEYYLAREEPVRKPAEKADAFGQRQDIWRERVGAARGGAEIVVAKFRQGEPGSVRCRFDGKRQVFENEDKNNGP